MSFERVFSGAPWEEKVGYCRIVKADKHIYVTGTAPVSKDGGVYAPGNPYEQAKRCIEIIENSLKKLDLDLSCIVRTRLFVTNIKLWKEFGKAHKEFFKNNPPATSMIEVKGLIDEKMLIEIEADGLILS